MRVKVTLNGQDVSPNSQQGQLFYPVWWVEHDTDDVVPDWLRIFGAMLLGCLVTVLSILVGSRFGWDIMAMIVLGGLALMLGWVLFRSSQNRGRQNRGQVGWMIYW